ncbi:hypothetical protein Asi02nite_70810 [Asanoa siamensis]|uniref:Uncharacterized protein n=1 Tax=Asanoa siamensis TaxID=926357 RepID=A0ABQ4D1Z5_9ACTN|nr:hypothetical protein Asi02nite_70810 [Asanoa siamensis]
MTFAGDEGTAKKSPKTMMLIAMIVATPTSTRRVRNRTMGRTYPMEIGGRCGRPSGGRATRTRSVLPGNVTYLWISYGLT